MVAAMMMMMMMMMVWVAIGFELAFAKGQLGKQITWIGGTLRIETHGVRAFVKRSIIDDIQETLIHFLSINVVAKKDLCSLIGKFNHAAGLLLAMRPFMDPLWAAWGGPSLGRQPGCIWINQIRTELEWFHTFFSGNGATIERFFSLDAFNRVGTVFETGADASPRGLGGWLSIDGAITQYFASPLTQADSDKY